MYNMEPDSKSIQLREVYAMNIHRGGPRFNNIMGTWTEAHGLHVPFPNIWTRRSDLQGLRLRTAVNTYTIASRVIYGNKSDVLDAVGYFQGCILSFEFLFICFETHNFMRHSIYLLSRR